MLAPWKKRDDKPRQHIKKQRHYFTNKDHLIQSYGFSSSQCMDKKKLDYNWTINYAEELMLLNCGVGEDS